MSEGETQLSSRDLAHLCSVLRSVAPKWVDLGLQVGVAMDDLEVIRSNPLILHEGVRGFLREMLSRWLKDAGQPTLEDIVTALQQVAIGEEKLASVLKEEFLKLRASRRAEAEAVRLETVEATEAEEEEFHQPTKKLKLSNSSEDVHVCNTRDAESDTCSQLGLEDLIDVSVYLQSLHPDQVFSLGLALGLLVTTLNPIKNSPTFLDEMLTAWLSGRDTVKRRGGHTWRSLMDGLRNKRVNQTEMAARVEQDKCQR